jgi:hypothetical protein
MLPPDFDVPELDENLIRKELNEAERNPQRKFTDHEDDVTDFEIGIINKENQGLLVSAKC